MPPRQRRERVGLIRIVTCGPQEISAFIPFCYLVLVFFAFGRFTLQTFQQLLISSNIPLFVVCLL